MHTVYLLVIVQENGDVHVDSVHGTREGAETMAETLREQNRNQPEGLQFDFCHVVDRAFYP